MEMSEMREYRGVSSRDRFRQYKEKKMVLIVTNLKREIPDEGTHRATLIEITDLGSVQTKYGMKEKVLFTFEVEQADGEGKKRRAFKRFSKTLHPKGGLRKAIRAITGEDPGDEFDLAQLIGRTVQILIEHQVSEGSTYANITAIVRMKSTEPPSGAAAPVVRPSGPNPIRPKNSSGNAEVLPDDGNVTAVATPDNTGAKRLAS